MLYLNRLQKIKVRLGELEKELSNPDVVKDQGIFQKLMKESAYASLSFLESHCKELGIAATAFKRHDFHLHVPAGAIPKDGPSAGIAVVAALASLLTNRPVRHDVAMTGEVTLRGRVLPVGGIRAKVLAARRAGVQTVIMPLWNRKDLADVPQEVLDDLRFLYVENVEDVLEAVLKREGTPGVFVDPAATRPAEGIEPPAERPSHGKEISPLASDH